MAGYAFTWLKNGTLGGWQIEPVVGGALPQKVATAFSEAAGTLVGASYNPVMYVGKQNVNGFMHAVVAEQTMVTKTPVKNIVLMKFYEKDMDCSLYSIEPIVESGFGVGSLVVDAKTEIPEDATEAFNTVTAGWVGVNIVPAALVATKVVKGVDYTFIATVTPVYPGAVASLKLVTVNAVAKTIDFADIL